MKFILHVGAHKTGTTTIQEFCAQNRAALRTAGLIYPDLKQAGGRESKSHHDLAAAFSSSPRRKPTKDALRALIKNLANSAGKNEVVLFSAESIYRHVLDDSETKGFWEGHRDYLAAIAELFAPYQTEIVLVLRRQDNFAESLFQDNVKAKSYAGQFQSFLEDFAHFWAYRRRIELMRVIFGQVSVLSFEELSKVDLCANFLEAIGVEAADMQPVARQNTGLPTQLVLFQQALNSRLQDDGRKRLRRSLIDLSAKNHFDFEKIRLFTVDDRRAFCASFADENSWLSEQFGTQQAPFFPENFSDNAGRSYLLPKESFDIMGELLNRVPETASRNSRGLLNTILRRQK